MHGLISILPKKILYWYDNNKRILPWRINTPKNKKGFVYTEILNRWNYLVGNEISKVSFPKTFKPSGKNAPGTLIINIQRGNEINIEFSKNTIIEKINSFFGYKVLDSVRLETFNNLKENINKKKNAYIQKLHKKI